MSAREEAGITPDPSIKAQDKQPQWPERLGIIAGGGDIPQKLVNSCLSNNTIPIVVGVKGHADQVQVSEMFRMGQAQSVMRYFSDNDVKDIVMIGSVTRPTVFNLWPDWATLIFFIKIWSNRCGDDGLLTAIKKELQQRGFTLRGAHEFLPELLIEAKIYHGVGGVKSYDADITLGVNAAKHLGLADKGQAVIVKEGKVIAEEDKRGTSTLIRKHGQEGAILVKMCKPQQDRSLDLPTIGSKTIEACAQKGMAGIVGEAGATYLIDAPECEAMAVKHDLFLVGVTVQS